MAFRSMVIVSVVRVQNAAGRGGGRLAWKTKCFANLLSFYGWPDTRRQVLLPIHW